MRWIIPWLATFEFLLVAGYAIWTNRKSSTLSEIERNLRQIDFNLCIIVVNIAILVLLVEVEVEVMRILPH